MFYCCAFGVAAHLRLYQVYCWSNDSPILWFLPYGGEQEKKKKQTQTYFWSETRYRYIFMHTKKASFPTFGECHNIVTMLSCVERQMEMFPFQTWMSEEQKVHATIATLNYFIFYYYFFFCTVFTECPQVCLLHLAPSCHPFGQNLDSIAPQSQ